MAGITLNETYVHILNGFRQFCLRATLTDASQLGQPISMSTRPEFRKARSASKCI